MRLGLVAAGIGAEPVDEASILVFALPLACITDCQRYILFVHYYITNQVYTIPLQQQNIYRHGMGVTNHARHDMQYATCCIRWSCHHCTQ